MNTKIDTRRLFTKLIRDLFFVCFTLSTNISLHSAFSLKNCTISNFLFEDEPKVLCYKMGFVKVPLQIPSNAKILDISYNAFVQLKLEDFKDLNHLQHLNISNNKISWIQEESFADLSNLTHLNLASNRLRRISAGTLLHLINLLELRLDDNSIVEIAESAFDMVQNLKVLNLTKNNLCHVEKVKPVLALPYLEELYIGSNHFTVFNSASMSLKPLSLEILDLSNNPFAKFFLTDNIFPALNHLDLSSCGQNGTMNWNVTRKSMVSPVKTLYFMDVQMSLESAASVLQSFKGSLNKLRLNRNVAIPNKTSLLSNACSPSLRIIRLIGNKIAKLSDKMFEPCSDLTELDLGENSISDLSPSIFRHFTQLQVLHLQCNKIKKVSESFQRLTTLEFIDLSRNSITDLSCGDFANLTKLKILHLYDNKISHIHSCLFKDLMCLETLKLGTNDLLEIGDAFTNGPQSLLMLQLPFNKLSKIKCDTFRNFSRLETLVLQDNQISEIEAFAFRGLENLTNLALSSNKLTAKLFSRHGDVFSGMPMLQSLDLFANSISFSDYILKHPPFSKLNLLKTLALHSQRRGVGVIPSNLLQGLSSLEMFYGGNMNLVSMNPATFQFCPNLWYLDLSKNAFSEDNSISAEFFHPIPKLTRLILSRTQLRSLNFLLNANLSRLLFLRAQGNVIDAVNKTLLQSLPQLKVLDLEKNTFSCDCDNAYFIEWAMTSNVTQVYYLNKYTCSYPPSLRGMTLPDFNTESCNVNIDFICFLCSSIAVLTTLFLSFFFQFFQIQMVYAYYLFLAFLYNRKKQQTQSCQYDAFISYNVRDEPWVMEELVPTLEGEQGWKLCLHHRDFEPGRPIMDNIIDGIYSSRKTICLITRNYLKSTWCSSEVQVASYRLFDEQKDVLILVFLEDIPTHQLSPYHRMRKLVKKKTYLHWPKPGDDTRIFWQKIKLALESQHDVKSKDLV